MKDRLNTLAFTLALIAIASTTPTEARENERERPNIVIIFADDLGYGDLFINTDDKTPEEVVGLIKSSYRKWLRGGG